MCSLCILRSRHGTSFDSHKGNPTFQPIFPLIKIPQCETNQLPYPLNSPPTNPPQIPDSNHKTQSIHSHISISIPKPATNPLYVFPIPIPTTLSIKPHNHSHPHSRSPIQKSKTPYHHPRSQFRGPVALSLITSTIPLHSLFLAPIGSLIADIASSISLRHARCFELS